MIMNNMSLHIISSFIGSSSRGFGEPCEPCELMLCSGDMEG